MTKVFKLSCEQEKVVAKIAKERGCGEEDVINEAIKLVAVFYEVESKGMELFYGNELDGESFIISGVINR